MKDYEVLAKFYVPIEQCEVVLRDSMYSGIQHAGCYLLRDTRDDPDTWALQDATKPAGYFNRPCKYVVALEDWGNTNLPLDRIEVDEFDLDVCRYCPTYAQALVEFQSVVAEILLEMNACEVQSETQYKCERSYEHMRKQEREQAAKEEFEQRLSEDPPFLV